MKKKVFISILTTLICIPLFMDTPLANTDDTWYTFAYGSMSQSATSDGNYWYNVVSIQLDKPYEGEFYLPWTFNVNIITQDPNSWNWVIYGATIETFTDNAIYLNPHGNTNITIEMSRNSTAIGEHYYKFNGIYNYSLQETTNYAYQIDAKLQNTNQTLNTILLAVNDLESYTDNIETLLNDIKGYVDVLDDIYTTLNTNTNYVFDIKGNVNTLKNIILQTMGSYVSNNTSLYQQMVDMLLSLDELITNTENIENSLNNLLNSDKLPIYSGSFIDLLNVNNAQWNSDIQGTYTTITGNSYTYDVYLLTGFKYVWFYAVDRDVSTIRPVFTSNNVTSSVTRTLRSHNLTYYMVETTVTSSNRYTFTWNATTNFNIYPLYFGTDWSMPSELMFIARNYYKDMYTSKLDEVVNAINNMSFDVDNLTVNATGITYNTTNTQVTNSITEYNTNIDQIYNIENNFALDFETYEQNYNPSFTDVNNFVLNGSGHMNQVITKIYNLDFVKYPTILTLAGIVLLALLGV